MIDVHDHAVEVITCGVSRTWPGRLETNAQAVINQKVVTNLRLNAEAKSFS